MNKIGNQFTSIEQVTGQYLSSQNKNLDKTEKGFSFEEILKLKQDASEDEKLKFSKHASMRLENRNIELTPSQSERLEAGVKRASEKGIQESLVMVDSYAFIVNVPNKTVVTAIDQEESENQVFTNIDGAVIA